MAPSATETITATVQKPQTVDIHLGKIKEIDTTYIDSDIELGKTGEPGAKVSLFIRPCLH